MGAWIETAEARRQVRGRRVAPYMGAWIETLQRRNNILIWIIMSHPTWVRGLKPPLWSGLRSP